MDPQANKQTIRGLVSEVWNQGEIDHLDRFVSSDFKDHAAPPGAPEGREGFMATWGAFRSAFPDLHIKIEDQIAEGDKVVSRVVMEGTHEGDLLGVPPSGKQVSVTGTRMDRIVDGKVTEHWAVYDQLGMMGQIGALPDSG